MKTPDKQNIHHLSALSHVTGLSVYIDDIAQPEGLLFGRIVYSKYAHAKIISIDISKAIKIDGVKAIADYRDIPGINNLGPIVHDELCLAVDEVFFIGQAILLIAAESYEACVEAEKLIHIEFDPLPHIIDLPHAIEAKAFLAPSRTIVNGTPDSVIACAKNIISGTLETGGQEHWYLEPQSSLCIPDEGKYIVHSATQNPTETQIIVSEVMGVPSNMVEVNVKRLGGGFGGRETQSNHFAAWAAILSHKTGRPVKITLQRDDDQKITGKRHPFLSEYTVAFNDDGQLTALDCTFHCNAGSSTDLTHGIMDRALLHIDNAYYIPHLRVTGHTYKTNLPSNTAFRGFGGPQGMAVIELIMDRVAQHLRLDSAEVRRVNFYGVKDRNITHYGQLIHQNHLETIWNRLVEKSDYFQRKVKVDDYNRKSRILKRGISLTPVKFGISFTTTFLNQAGALVHIYKDGSVLVSHGGTEMGQGLHTKIAQIAAAELGVSVEKITIGDTNTAKVPNTSPTAASSGSDLNGMAVVNAIEKLKTRLSQVAVGIFNEKSVRPQSIEKNVVFHDNNVFDSNHPNRKISFDELIQKAYLSQISLSATGFYRTPGIHWDKAKGKGTPFYYFSYSMAVSEVEVNILTGHHRILRTDIVFDVGDSLNKSIDLGQIEGGFIQGVGWCTSEDMKYDEYGNLLNHSPDTYKIPTISDIPEDFRIEILDNLPNPVNVRKSKAIGEPPFMLCFSVWLALRYAISAIADHKVNFTIPIPTTNEIIILASHTLQSEL